MSEEQFYIGQRLSLKDQRLTVRYIGPVTEKRGTWLGVEWDDTSRGRHDGTHDQVKYFTCRSKSPTAASFLRPDQPWDKHRSFLEALRDKYMPDDSASDAKSVYFSSKQAEEVGFEKFARRQAQLQGIHVLVLDRMRVRLGSPIEDGKEIASICANITDLDLSGNLIEALDEVLDLCSHLPELRRLTLDSNRFDVNKQDFVFENIDFLGLSDTLLESEQILASTRAFPQISQLAVASNELNGLEFGRLEGNLTKLQQLDLSNNEFATLPCLSTFSRFPQLARIILKHNQINRHVENASTDQEPRLPDPRVVSLDLAYSQVSSWSFLDALPEAYPELKHLRVTGNPLYSTLKSAEGKALTADDGYMLTIARLPGLETLNYSKITEKERLNAETYYLGQIAVELSLSAPDRATDIIARHPRWKALCEEYGEPRVDRAAADVEVDPNSLAARLITLTFKLSSGTPLDTRLRDWEARVPKSFSVYAVLGLVGKKLGVTPLKLRLIWETGEKDPAGGGAGQNGIEWWDSDDEEENGRETSGGTFVDREVELVPGTRPLGTYIESRAARVRVEMRSTV